MAASPTSIFLLSPQRNKAEAAAEATHRLNPDLKVTPSTQPLGPTTEHTYGDDFFSSVDGVAAALDSFEAREFPAWGARPLVPHRAHLAAAALPLHQGTMWQLAVPTI